ncbi:MAG: hypothetical protein AAGC44_02075 [Planctomycetota bacterium]
MPAKDLTPEQIVALTDTADPTTGVTYPAAGTQPWYEWLIRTVHRLAQSSAGDLAVYADEDAASSIYVAPGRCSIDGVALTYAGGALDLSLFNNATALVYVEDAGGSPSVGAATTLDGWPAGSHLKLAEVTLAGGQVATLLDRRFETILRA